MPVPIILAIIGMIKKQQEDAAAKREQEKADKKAKGDAIAEKLKETDEPDDTQKPIMRIRERIKNQVKKKKEEDEEEENGI